VSWLFAACLSLMVIPGGSAGFRLSGCCACGS